MADTLPMSCLARGPSSLQRKSPPKVGRSLNKPKQGSDDDVGDDVVDDDCIQTNELIREGLRNRRNSLLDDEEAASFYCHVDSLMN
mmetsp:Transcript_1587/g.1905  ORF Transcript_1587/g.1905 Transcript_1587/m.1905 type:complete len:86 (+) Transcript_1587:338-595(+)